MTTPTIPSGRGARLGARIRAGVAQRRGRREHPLALATDTGPEPLNASDAVEADTPARDATAARVGR